MSRVEVPEAVLERLLAQWNEDTVPNGEYRLAKCWSCGRKLRFGMYHVWFRGRQREAHLCRKCGKRWRV